MSDRCGPGCGWCGACTASWEGPDDQRPPVFCDECGGDAFHPVTCPLGTFCSHGCADEAERKFTQGMAKLGFMPKRHGKRLPAMPGQEKS